MDRCKATSKRTGEQCKNVAVRGFSVCRFHGAGSKDKPGGRPIKHGRYSKFLPERLAGRYGEALADPQLLELRDEIALVGTRQSELLTHLDSGLSLQRWQDAQAAHAAMVAAIRSKDSQAMQVAIADLGAALDAGAGDYAVWREVVELTEQRRKLVESEHKHLIAARQMITSERAMVLLAAVVDIIRRNVEDREVLAVISSEIRALTTVEHDGN